MIKHKILMEITPRVSLVYSGGESRKHNFRGSFQTGFRNPTTQDQYIGFNVGSAFVRFSTG
jgi:outer membrane receptor protein involved in Fe transport